MSKQARRALIGGTLLTVALFSCQKTQTPPDKPKNSRQEQELSLTLAGFIKDHPEEGKLEGVCGPDSTRNALNCDIYNGLAGWRITEVTLLVSVSPYSDDDKRFYRERVSIEPLKAEHVSVRLGLQLPPDDRLKLRGGRVGLPEQHWDWFIASAKGYRAN